MFTPVTLDHWQKSVSLALEHLQVNSEGLGNSMCNKPISRDSTSVHLVKSTFT